MFTKLVSGNDLRGYGGELLRKGACKLIEKLALSSVLIKETEVLDAFWDIIFTTVPHTEPNVQVKCSCKFLGDMSSHSKSSIFKK